MNIAFFGDPHGDYSAVNKILEQGNASEIDAFVFLGDYDLDEPFSQKIAKLREMSDNIYWIHGNHESETKEKYNFAFNGGMEAGFLHGKVVDVGGLKIAGLGGVFRGRIWYPPYPHQYYRWKDFCNSKDNGNHVFRHTTSIFPEAFDRLRKQKADILVTHESPTTHRFGFHAIDRLAEDMGVRLVVHGHHHEEYQGRLKSGIVVNGVDKGGLLVKSL